MILLALTACERNSDISSNTNPGTSGPPSAGVDSDGDGLDDLDEILGWEIAFDGLGFGPGSGMITVITVTSDPTLADTDGDGLNDLEEFLYRTHPADDDTDGDLLSDLDELQRWGTSPTSIDTDGDATGPAGTSAPDQALFDGAEVRESKTSPRLADTDGDGWTDFEELRDTSRHPLLAEVPRAQVNFAGQLEMFLNVEYQESLGVEEQYGSSFSVSESNTQSVSIGGQVSYEVGASVTVGAEAGVPSGVTASSSVTAHASFGLSASFGRSREASQTTAEEYNRYVSDSRSRTESTASGTVTVGVEVENVGASTFGMEQLALTLLFYNPDAESGSQDFRTLGTLLPKTTDLVLAPGERSQVIQFEASDVNPDLMKEFLARPASLVLQPTSFGLTNQDGIDFDFITESVASRTSVVDIRFGADEYANYFVASDVGRDSDGNPTGIRMQEVLEILGYADDYETRMQRFEDDNGDYTIDGSEILTSLDGRGWNQGASDRTHPQSYWIATRATTNPARTIENTDFDDITLLPGEEMQLIYVFDFDDDGMSESLEGALATETGARDSDDDGLTDKEEIVTGKMAVTSAAFEDPHLRQYGYPKLVFPNPLLDDSDMDGLRDAEEIELRGTDPTHPDTDRDGIKDGFDECPLNPSRILYVWPQEDRFPTGTGWNGNDAFVTLADAVAEARIANGDDSDCTDDVSEIWVARGTYQPEQTLVLEGKGVQIFGGFSGGEVKRGQRDPNPITNGTVLSGMELNNIRLLLRMNPNPRFEGRPFALDGFTVSDCANPGNRGGAVYIQGANPAQDGSLGRVEIRNCLFSDNQAGQGGAIASYRANVVVEDCVFSGNHSSLGGALDGTLGSTEVRRSLFTANASTSGGAISAYTDDLVIEDCQFLQNRADADFGGAIYVYQSTVNAIGCQLIANQAEKHGGGLAVNDDGVSVVNFAQSSFLRNRVVVRDSSGSAVYVKSGPGIGSNVFLANCTISENVTATGFEQSSQYGAVYGPSRLRNCVLYGNVRESFTAVDGSPGQIADTEWDYPIIDEAAQIWRESDVQNSAIQSLGYNSIQYVGSIPSNTHNEFPWARPGGFIPEVQQFRYLDLPSLTYGLSSNNNIDLDASPFADPSGRLAEGSPCIDGGFNFVDIDPQTSGLQLLPETDLGGQARIQDGDGDGLAIVDVGAYEADGQ